MKITEALGQLAISHPHFKGITDEAAEKIRNLESEVNYWVGVSQNYAAKLKGIHDASFAEPLTRTTKTEDGSYHVREL